MKNTARFSVWGIALVLLAGCSDYNEKPNFIYMPDMVYSPALKAQEGGDRPPVKGTVARDAHERYPFKKDDTEENLRRVGVEIVNPLKATRDVLARGQHMYNTYCLVCHGQYGEGDGTIVPKFPRPPSLQSDKVRTWPDGRIYHNITVGQNIMGPYGSQIEPADRWAIVYYVRALQRAKNPSPADLQYAEQAMAR